MEEEEDKIQIEGKIIGRDEDKETRKLTSSGTSPLSMTFPYGWKGTILRKLVGLANFLDTPFSIRDLIEGKSLLVQTPDNRILIVTELENKKRMVIEKSKENNKNGEKKNH